MLISQGVAEITSKGVKEHLSLIYGKMIISFLHPCVARQG